LGVIAALQIGYNCTQWRYGEITGRQFAKKTVGNLAGFAGGFVGGAAGVFLGSAAVLAAVSNPAGWIFVGGGIIGALILGGLSGWGTESLFTWLGETFFPVHILEPLIVGWMVATLRVHAASVHVRQRFQ